MEQSLKYLERYYSTLNHTFDDYVAEQVLEATEKAERKAKKAGKTEGIAIGKSEGIAIGKTEGIAIGKTEGLLEAAKNMLNLGINIEIISKSTGISIEELKKIQ